MIRTYSLLKAVQNDWEIHFIALHATDECITEVPHAYRNSIFIKAHVESFDHLENVRKKIRNIPGSEWLLWLRNQLKAIHMLRPIFWTMNVPFLLYQHQKERETIGRKIRSEHFDAVLFDYTKLAHYFSLVKPGDVKKILNVHNLESDTARQLMLNDIRCYNKALHWLQWKIYRLYERFFLPKCDLLLTSSSEDAKRYRTLAPSVRSVVIPNAVDTDLLKPLPPPAESRALIYSGRMDYPPNFEAVHVLCRDILPKVAEQIPEVRLYIVGKNPPGHLQKLASDRVIVTGYVDDVVPFWCKASALVVPLSMGGGTRIKILEAMAVGRPVISTSKGCEGLDVIHGKHLLIADHPEGFAHCVVQVLSEPSQHAEMIRAARRLVVAKYSFASIEVVLRSALEEQFANSR